MERIHLGARFQGTDRIGSCFSHKVEELLKWFAYRFVNDELIVRGRTMLAYLADCDGDTFSFLLNPKLSYGDI
jgi:hypothetical protein